MSGFGEDLREGTMYSVRYRDRAGGQHAMIATYLGKHKFGGTSWSLRPLPGVKNLAENSILELEQCPADADPVPPHPPEESTG
jgi:hypothetical protein